MNPNSTQSAATAKTALAHELFAAAQLAPGEGIEDAVSRIAAALTAATAQPAAPQGVAYAELPEFEELDDDLIDLACSTGALYRVDFRRAWEVMREGLRASNGQAPAAGAVAGPPIDQEATAYNEWFNGEQVAAYDGMWAFGRAAWKARASLAPSGFDAADMATASAQGFRDGVASPAASAGSEPVAWREHVEQRLLTWRQRFVNRSGDQLALDDFMDKQSLDDLIDFVCDEWAPLTHPSPPEGMVMVPKEPTEAMLEAVDEEVGGHCYSCSKWRASYDDCRRIWAAMIAAAPPTTSAGSGKGE